MATFARNPAATLSEQPASRWWTRLSDPQLDVLIEAAIAQNPSVDIARARLREARASLAAARAKELPNTGSTAAYLHSGNITSFLGTGGGGDGGGDLNLYAISLDATWEVDLFGAQRRAAEAAAAATQASRASLTDVLVSLTAEVAQNYIALRDAQQREALTLQNIEIESQILKLMQLRRAGGTVSDLEVARIENQLDTTRALLGPIKFQIEQALNRLAILTARAPGSLDTQLATAAPAPLPPEILVIGDPGGMLRRRPDIAMAERRLAQQTAVVGESIAAQFPKITLLGDLGFTALSPDKLFNAGSFTYLVAPVLQWSPFDFGRNRARINESRAERDEAEADYRRTVLAALEDAESSLAQYGQQRETVTVLARVRASAERVYALTEIRLRGGTASTTDVLDADTRRVQAELNYEQALAQLSLYYVALQKSLGLGWIETEAG